MTRPRPSLSKFADVKQVLDTAIEKGGANYTLATPAQAIHWRHRAYSFRSFWSKELARKLAHIPGAATDTPYDPLMLRIDKGSCVVQILVNSPTGVLTDLEGHEVVPQDSQPLPVDKVDDMLDEASRLMKEIGIE